MPLAALHPRRPTAFEKGRPSSFLFPGKGLLWSEKAISDEVGI